MAQGVGTGVTAGPLCPTLLQQEAVPSGARSPTSLTRTEPGAVPGRDGADEPPKRGSGNTADSSWGHFPMLTITRTLLHPHFYDLVLP